MTLDAILMQFYQVHLDVNQMLRRANQVYGEMLSALRLPATAERRKAIVAIETELKSKSVPRTVMMVLSMLIGSRKVVTESTGNTLLALLIPAFHQADMAQTRSQLRRDLVQTGFALAVYHAEHGTYPERLGELVPTYLDALPLDKFSDNALVYAARENGFLIYSVGVNGKDEGGRMSGAGSPDDIAFEVPPPIDE